MPFIYPDGEGPKYYALKEIGCCLMFWSIVLIIGFVVRFFGAETP